MLTKGFTAKPIPEQQACQVLDSSHSEVCDVSTDAASSGNIYLKQDIQEQKYRD